MAQGSRPSGTNGDKSYGSVASPDYTDTLRKLQGYFRLWSNTTDTARKKWRRDYDMTEGNGKQWTAKDREQVKRTGRPVLEFNQVLPQVELVSGMQRGMSLDYTAIPRGLEDRRLGEVASAALRAAKDFGRMQRISDKVFDDATICGMGVWEIIHTFDDAEDLIWGDIIASRINPMAFIWDPWATQPDLQDGSFMGKATWMSIEDFKDRYPNHAHRANPGEWLNNSGHALGASDDYGLGPNMMPELWDHETGRIRVLTMWHKVPKKISLIVDQDTGQVQEVESADAGQKILGEMAARMGREAVAPMSIMSGADSTSAIVDQMGMPATDPRSGQPLIFANEEGAQGRINELSNQFGMQVFDRYKVINRKARVPKYCELTYWDILDDAQTPFNDRLYPYVAYISRQFSDDPESIMGVVRNLHDPQQEYNKRYSNLLAHVNSSSHSGWLNRKSVGANSRELEMMGSKPGVVVEYANVKPEQIRPVEMSQGHFAMLQTSERNILRISGINAELVGQTTQTTVSGRAIRARQEGGTTILKPRFRSYEESELDVARMLLSRIQQFYPVEKLKRIIGVAELSTPLGPTGQSIFADPTTGAPLNDMAVMSMLSQLRAYQFDLVLRLEPQTASERQAQFEQAVQLAGLITSTGRPLGSNTMAAMIDLADMPTRLAEGLKRDAQQEAMMQQQMAGGEGGGNPENEAIQKLIANVRGGRAGGSEGVVGGV